MQWGVPPRLGDHATRSAGLRLKPAEMVTAELQETLALCTNSFASEVSTPSVAIRLIRAACRAQRSSDLTRKRAGPGWL